MSFFFLILYLIGFYIRPGELFLFLGPFRIMLVLGVITILLTGFKVVSEPNRNLRAPQIFLMALFTAMIVLSPLTQGWFGGTVRALVRFGDTAMAFFLVALNLTSLRRMRVMASFMVILTLVLVVQGILAYHFGFMQERLVYQQSRYWEAKGGTAPNLEESESDDTSSTGHLKRMTALGLMNDPNDLAQGILTVLPFVGMAWRRRQPMRNLVLVIFPLLLFMYGLYLTHSRTGELGLLVLAALAFRERLGNIGSGILTGMLLLGITAVNFSGGREISSREGSARGRLDAWAAGLSMLRSSPVWGVGYGGFVDHHERTAHNSYVLCFAELGLAGYFVWLSLLIVTIIIIARIRKIPVEEDEDEEFRRWAKCIGLGLYGFLVAAFFLSRTYTDTLYLVLGMATALVCLVRRAGKPLEFPPLRYVVPVVGLVEVGSIIAVFVLVRGYL